MVGETQQTSAPPQHYKLIVFHSLWMCSKHWLLCNVGIYSIYLSVYEIHHISAHKLYCSVFNPVYCVLAEELWRLHWELLPSTQPPETLPRQQSWSFSSSQNPQNTSQTTILVFLKFSIPLKHLQENSFGLFEVLKIFQDKQMPFKIHL